MGSGRQLDMDVGRRLHAISARVDSDECIRYIVRINRNGHWSELHLQRTSNKTDDSTKPWEAEQQMEDIPPSRLRGCPELTPARLQRWRQFQPVYFRVVDSYIIKFNGDRRIQGI